MPKVDRSGLRLGGCTEIAQKPNLEGGRPAQWADSRRRHAREITCVSSRGAEVSGKAPTVCAEDVEAGYPSGSALATAAAPIRRARPGKVLDDHGLAELRERRSDRCAPRMSVRAPRVRRHMRTGFAGHAPDRTCANTPSAIRAEGPRLREARTLAWPPPRGRHVEAILRVRALYLRCHCDASKTDVSLPTGIRTPVTAVKGR